MGASVYTERSNREQYSEETVTSITGTGLSRARLDDRFSAFSRFALRAFSTETTGCFGGTGTGFDGLEDAEGDECAAQSVMQSCRCPK